MSCESSDPVHGFVGRTKELHDLEALLAGTGHVAVAVVDGPSGIGKTRLLAEFARRAAARGVAVLSGQATEFERALPFKLFLDACTEAVNLPWFFAAGTRTAKSSGTYPNYRYTIFHHIRTTFSQAASHAGLLLLLDDLQWIDGASAELLGFLLRHPPTADPMVITLSHRSAQCPTQVARILAGLSTPPVRIRLPPLAAEDIDHLLRGLTPRRRRMLRVASDGNPLYLKLLVGMPTATVSAMARGLPLEGNEAAHLASEVIRAELSSLPHDQQTVLAAAAVAGATFDASVVSRILQSAATRVGDVLDVLAQRGVIEPAEGQLRFVHPLLRAAAYRLRGPHWRADAHASAARYLSDIGAPPALRAQHLEHALPPGATTEARELVAAANLMLHSAPSVSARWLRTALRALLRGHNTATERSQVRLLLGTALVASGQLLAAREVLGELLQGPCVQQYEAVALAALCERLMNQPDRAYRLLVSYQHAQPETDESSSGLLSMELSLFDLMEGRTTLGLDRAIRLSNHARPELAAAGAALATIGELASGSAHAAVPSFQVADSRLTALEDDQLRDVLEVLPTFGWSAWVMERYPTALRHVQRTLAVAERCGHCFILPHSFAVQAAIFTAVGRLPEAIEVADQAEELAHAFGASEPLCLAMAMRLRPLLWTGGPDAVAPVLDALHTLRQPANTWWYAAAVPAVIDMEISLGRAPAVTRAATLLGLVGREAPRDPLLASRLATGVRVALAAGDLDQAGSWARQAIHCATSHRLPGQLGLARMASAQVLAATGVRDRAKTEALLGTRYLHIAGLPVWEAQAHLTLAELAADVGDHSTAESQWGSARGLLMAAGATWLLDQSSSVRRRTSARQFRPSRKRAGANDLTQRERQVAELVAEGLTSRAIAQRLYLSPRTVEAHLARVFAKLGVRSRAAVARRLDHQV